MRNSSDGAVFTARRALWAVTLNLTLGIALTALAVANLTHQIQTDDGPWLASAIFAVLAVFFLQQGWTQFRDRAAVIEIGPAGLRLPLASADPVPWPRIRNIRAARGIPGLGGGRIDVTVDVETFARLKFGQRFMGDIVVKRHGTPNTFSVITSQLEENTAAIFTAIQRYWSPTRGYET